MCTEVVGILCLHTRVLIKGRQAVYSAALGTTICNNVDGTPLEFEKW